MLTEYDFEPYPEPHPESPEDIQLLRAAVLLCIGAVAFLVVSAVA